MLRTPVNSLKADNLIVNITGGPNLGMGEVTQIMNFLHSEFGGGENTAMGAVIDENQGDTIEVFILGTTNLNSSRRLRKIPEASQREELLNFDQPEKTSKTKGSTKRDLVHSSTTQGEFEFLDDIDESRGFFDKTEKNLFNGEDLDVPTYLRRGIKIVLK